MDDITGTKGKRIDNYVTTFFDNLYLDLFFQPTSQLESLPSKCPRRSQCKPRSALTTSSRSAANHTTISCTSHQPPACIERRPCLQKHQRSFRAQALVNRLALAPHLGAQGQDQRTDSDRTREAEADLFRQGAFLNTSMAYTGSES
jgi:hypothetical protein